LELEQTDETALWMVVHLRLGSVGAAMPGHRNADQACLPSENFSGQTRGELLAFLRAAVEGVRGGDLELGRCIRSILRLACCSQVSHSRSADITQVGFMALGGNLVAGHGQSSHYDLPISGRPGTQCSLPHGCQFGCWCRQLDLSEKGRLIWSYWRLAEPALSGA
jgi:hypothetical protein